MTPSLGSAPNPSVRPSNVEHQHNSNQTTYISDSDDCGKDESLAPPLKPHRNQKRVHITPQTTTTSSKRHKNSTKIDPDPTSIIHISQPQPVESDKVQIHLEHTKTSEQSSISSSSISMTDNKSIAEPEFIDLAIGLPTTCEPDYFDENNEEDAIRQNSENDQDNDFEEHYDNDEQEDDESYSGVNFNERVCTENDDCKAGLSGLGDSYAGTGYKANGSDGQG